MPAQSVLDKGVGRGACFSRVCSVRVHYMYVYCRAVADCTRCWETSRTPCSSRPTSKSCRMRSNSRSRASKGSQQQRQRKQGQKPADTLWRLCLLLGVWLAQAVGAGLCSGQVSLYSQVSTTGRAWAWDCAVFGCQGSQACSSTPCRMAGSPPDLVVMCECATLTPALALSNMQQLSNV